MAYTVSCANFGANCPGSFTTESRDELKDHAVMHMERAHSDIEINEEFKAELEEQIKTV